MIWKKCRMERCKNPGKEMKFRFPILPAFCYTSIQVGKKQKICRNVGLNLAFWVQKSGSKVAKHLFFTCFSFNYSWLSGSDPMIYTVSGLTSELKELIEESYPFVWISGEISNFFTPASGHGYFSLKDSKSVISGVMFKNQRRRLKFDLENGMKITGMGRLSLYEPRGSYQIIFEHIEPEGAGSLQAAFEQLKKKLFAQGFFDETHKKKIPFLPARISVITSGTGAAVRDIINVSQRRFPGVQLEILPVTVQGRNAEVEVTEALRLVNAMGTSDLVIVARGGGSLEDLAAFNSETVARAVFDSVVPVISAVGHETDFTICDFTADLRAPTPSAAAHLAVPVQSELETQIVRLAARLSGSLHNRALVLRQKIPAFRQSMNQRLRAGVQQRQQRIDEAALRMTHQLKSSVAAEKQRLPGLQQSMVHQLQSTVAERKQNLRRMEAQLRALSPLGVLDRGYSLTETADGAVVRDATAVKKGDQIKTRFAKGSITSEVIK